MIVLEYINKVNIIKAIIKIKKIDINKKNNCEFSDLLYKLRFVNKKKDEEKLLKLIKLLIN